MNLSADITSPWPGANELITGTNPIEIMDGSKIRYRYWYYRTVLVRVRVHVRVQLYQYRTYSLKSGSPRPTENEQIALIIFAIRGIRDCSY